MIAILVVFGVIAVCVGGLIGYIALTDPEALRTDENGVVHRRKGDSSYDRRGDTE